ncbi:hypothetical protein [Falsirhodobacter sp. 1013]|uniref:hypothetical protein n=1 Tax=Falsirhodobacter sp. 1013 TaxID=3417566 RepID=UPI003EBF6581
MNSAGLWVPRFLHPEHRYSRIVEQLATPGRMLERNDMLKLAMLPAAALAATLIASPVLAQDTPPPASDKGTTVAPNATPAGPNVDENVTKEETSPPEAMDPPDEGSSGAPIGTTGSQDLDANEDAGSEDEDRVIKPAQ